MRMSKAAKIAAYLGLSLNAQSNMDMFACSAFARYKWHCAIVLKVRREVHQ
jgi:hypothetical protein